MAAAARGGGRHNMGSPAAQRHYREEPVGWRWCTPRGSRLLTSVLQYAPRVVVDLFHIVPLTINSMESDDRTIASDLEWTHREAFTDGAAWTRLQSGTQWYWWKRNVG